MDKRLEDIKRIPRAMRSYVYMLYEFVLELSPQNVLEIGVQRGQSTKAMLLAMKDLGAGRLVSIDHKNRDGLLGDGFDDLAPHWHFIRGDSHAKETFDAAAAALNNDEKYDILFIDGDHKMPGCWQDFEEYSKLVKPGGLILMHDVTNKNEDVKDAWAMITWEKFAINWGKAGAGVVPGFGLVRKPF